MKKYLKFLKMKIYLGILIVLGMATQNRLTQKRQPVFINVAHNHI